MKNKVTVLDLYSGLGGFTSGFDERFKIVTVDNCSMKGTTKELVDHVMNCDDYLKKFPSETFDVVVGGPPCISWACFGMSNVSQNLDSATCLEQIQTDGLAGIRTMLEAVLQYKPKFWIIENVQRAAPWFASLLQITQSVRENGTLKKYKTASKHPSARDKKHPSYVKTKRLADRCFKKYGRPIMLHAGCGSGGRYFFGHFPPMRYSNASVTKKFPNIMKKNGYYLIRGSGTPATRSKIDKEISSQFACSIINSLKSVHGKGQRTMDYYARREARRKRRLCLVLE